MKIISVQYKSGCFTVDIPTIMFLGVWLGSFVLVLALLDWQVPNDFVGVLLFCGGIPLGLAVAVVTYPLLLRLASRGRGELRLESTVLEWRSGRRQHKLDLTQDHYASIAANERGASLTLNDDDRAYVNLLFRGLSREEVLRIFPAPFFIDRLVITPEMGSWGFDVMVDNASAKNFAIALLEVLWKQRRQNRYYLLYEKFPWQRRPRPDFHHIRLIEWAKRSPEEEALIQRLEQEFMDGLTDSYVRLTPDYVIGWAYQTMRSNLSGLPDYYCVMPLGYIQAEVSIPQPDWKPFIIGHTLIEALETAFGRDTSTYGGSLEDRRYLYLRGREVDGTPLEMAFDWYTTADAIHLEKYYEAECVVKFIQAMEQSIKASSRPARASI